MPGTRSGRPRKLHFVCVAPHRFSKALLHSWLRCRQHGCLRVVGLPSKKTGSKAQVLIKPLSHHIKAVWPGPDSTWKGLHQSVPWWPPLQPFTMSLFCLCPWLSLPFTPLHVSKLFTWKIINSVSNLNISELFFNSLFLEIMPTWASCTAHRNLWPKSASRADLDPFRLQLTPSAAPTNLITEFVGSGTPKPILGHVCFECDCDCAWHWACPQQDSSEGTLSSAFMAESLTDVWDTTGTRSQPGGTRNKWNVVHLGVSVASDLICLCQYRFL